MPRCAPRPGTGRLVVAGAWVGEPGPQRAARDRAGHRSRAGEVAWVPVRAARRRAGGRPVRRRAGGGPRRQAAGAEPAGTRRRTSRPWPRTPSSAAYLIDPSDASYTPRRAAGALCRARSWRVDDDVPEGQLDLGGDGVDAWMPACRGGARRGPPGRPARRGARRPGPADVWPTRSRFPWCGCWHAWSTSASASTGRCSKGLGESLRAECAKQSGRRSSRRRGRSSTSTPRRSCARSCSTKLGLPPQKKTKTGPSTDHQTLEKLRG